MQFKYEFSNRNSNSSKYSNEGNNQENWKIFEKNEWFNIIVI